MRSLLFFFLLTSLLIACQSNSTNQPANKTDEKTPAAPVDEKATPNKYTLTPFTPSTEYADAKIESVNYSNNTFTFGLGEGSYQLGVQTPDADAKMCANSGKGQHIHLIVNNSPYLAKYEPSFEHKFPHGDHYVLAFLSRSYHESIKTKDAHWLKKAHVHGGAFSNPQDVTAPMLFYSRPKGTYTGKKDTEKVMLDFYLANVVLGTDYQVRAEINGEVHLIDRWQPYYIEGLPMGENTIKLTLIDKDGNRVRTPLNPVARRFTLQPDPVEEAAK